MLRRTLAIALSTVAFSLAAQAADSSNMDQIKAAALKMKQSSPSHSGSTKTSRTGSLIYNVTINRKTGAPAAPFYCTAGVFHSGDCAVEDEEGYCYSYYDYELYRQVQATGSANTYSCQVRINYNFPNADDYSYIWPTIEVYHASTTTGLAPTNGSVWRALKPIAMPTTSTTTFTISIDQ